MRPLPLSITSLPGAVPPCLREKLRNRSQSSPCLRIARKPRLEYECNNKTNGNFLNEIHTLARERRDEQHIAITEPDCFVGFEDGRSLHYQATVMGDFARRTGWCAMTPQKPSAHQRGTFASSSLNGSLSANCIRLTPADLVILATTCDALRSMLSFVRGENVEEHAYSVCEICCVLLLRYG